MKNVNYLRIDRILLHTNLNENPSGPYDYSFCPIKNFKKKHFYIFFNHMT